jgi:type II secretory pathway pseudopilin PulG
MFNFQPQPNTRAFTLIETLVAITILMLAVAGPLTIAHKGLFSAVYAKEQITAFYLAQDAIEYIRSVRDSNELSIAAGSAIDWLEGLQPCISDDNSSACQIDTRAPELNSTGTEVGSCSGACSNLQEFTNGSQIHYGHYGSGGEESNFRRTIRIMRPVLGNDVEEAAVSVTIEWTIGGINRDFTVQENLFNR